ncbi:hypothetical protein Hypma_005479 [Hypsizygus marmoreus]|uniref:Uncharacterized protein n=1 Tax=Hypsizygus marmoreus TaxID=39966 RepID=A0A369J5Q6_HYPMA|nr:hypothetical protein Hypma_005479 [Hypsizygus marmoreus]
MFNRASGPSNFGPPRLPVEDFNRADLLTSHVKFGNTAPLEPTIEYVTEWTFSTATIQRLKSRFKADPVAANPEDVEMRSNEADLPPPPSRSTSATTGAWDRSVI